MINWIEIEEQAGQTIEEMYKRLKSCRKVGRALAPYVGIVQGISYTSIKNYLQEQEKKTGRSILVGQGGANYRRTDGPGKARVIYDKIMAVKDLKNKYRFEIIEETGITGNQFSHCMRYFDVEYKWRNIKRHPRNIKKPVAL